eukprot:1525602-Rhodomonas_salina.2
MSTRSVCAGTRVQRFAVPVVSLEGIGVKGCDLKGSGLRCDRGPSERHQTMAKTAQTLLPEPACSNESQLRE